MHIDYKSQSIQYQSIGFRYISVSDLGQPSFSLCIFGWVFWLYRCLADHPSLQWLQYSIFEVYHIGTFTENIYQQIRSIKKWKSVKMGAIRKSLTSEIDGFSCGNFEFGFHHLQLCGFEWKRATSFGNWVSDWVSLQSFISGVATRISESTEHSQNR